MSTPKHCFVAAAGCSISAADAPAPPGLDPDAWLAVGTIVVCSCSCSVCNPPKRKATPKKRPRRG